MTDSIEFQKTGLHATLLNQFITLMSKSSNICNRTSATAPDLPDQISGNKNTKTKFQMFIFLLQVTA